MEERISAFLDLSPLRQSFFADFRYEIFLKGESSEKSISIFMQVFITSWRYGEENNLTQIKL